MPFEVVILAAGKGQRMHSQIPKVLQDLSGRPLLDHVLQTAKQLRPQQIHIIYGHGAKQVKSRFADEDALSWVLQDIQLGTGHAVSQALPFCSDENQILVLYGDVPLVSIDTLQRLLAKATDESLALLTCHVDKPHGFGRILRDEFGIVEGIAEEKDATFDQKLIKEIFTGIMVAPGGLLRDWLSQINNNNAQSEYLLTDITLCAVKQNIPIDTVAAKNTLEIQGVNDKLQLATLERAYQLHLVQQLMKQGATLRDPARVDIRGKVKIGKDVLIDINVIFEGNVSLGNNVSIGANCTIRDCKIADNVTIKENSVLEQSHIASRCVVGPFARIRPNSFLNEGVQIGNFVEIKNSELGRGSKAAHLSYVGDAVIGCTVNLGAGTVTCNYDGANKHKTIIGDNAFIGSGTQLVAPITIGTDATIGAGSTITQNPPEGKLTLARAKQTTISDWQRPSKLQTNEG